MFKTPILILSLGVYFTNLIVLLWTRLGNDLIVRTITLEAGWSKSRQATKDKCDVELRNLESLLQKNLGAQLTLLKFQAQNLLPKGANHCNAVLKVTSMINRRKDAPREDLELVTKMTEPIQFRKRRFNGTFDFEKEFFIFEQLIPNDQKLLKEVGFKDWEFLAIAPKIYGTRLSLDPESYKFT